jgi:hypothetical protein
MYPHFNNLHNKHVGETCIVVGNGPSLRNVPDEFLCTYPTFGTNRIYLRFTPDYYVAINPLVIDNNRDEIDLLMCPRFIRGGMGLGGYQLQRSSIAPFSFEPLKWVHEGWTVTYVCLQLAYWMGFTTVLLVGVDHRYTFNGKPNEKRRMEGDDPNHFDPDYFRGQEWNNPDLARSEDYYEIARDVYAQAGRRIVNLTEGSALDVFEKGTIAEWS